MRSVKTFHLKDVDTKNKTDFRKPWNLNKSLLNDDREARNWSFGADIKRKYYIKYCISETQFSFVDQPKTLVVSLRLSSLSDSLKITLPDIAIAHLSSLR